MNWGKLLKEKRESRGISIKEVAERMALKEISIYKTEKSENLNTDTVERYCQAIGVTMRELFEPDRPVRVYNEMFQKIWGLRNTAQELVNASFPRRELRIKMVTIEDICNICGLVYDDFKDIEKGEFRGSLQDLYVYYRFLGVEITYNIIHKSEVEITWPLRTPEEIEASAPEGLGSMDGVEVK